MKGCLIDSNILVYAHDSREHIKQQQAVELVDVLTYRGLTILSVQCLTEFFRTVRWKLPEPLTHAEALEQIELFTRTCRVLDLTPDAVVEGCKASVQYGLSFWDSLIWAVARVNSVSQILSEDAEHDRLIGGVRYLNPFHPDFDLQAVAAV